MRPDKRSYGRRARSGRRLKNLVVDPALQWRFAFRFMTVVFLVSVATNVLASSLLLQQAERRIIALVRDPTSAASDSLYFILFFASVASPIVAAGAVGAWSLFLTHRISGPLLLIRRWLAEIRNGRLPELRPLRAHDQLHAFHAEFSRTVEALRVRTENDRCCLDSAINNILALYAVNDERERRPMSVDAVIGELKSMRAETVRFLGVHGTESGTLSVIKKAGIVPERSPTVASAGAVVSSDT